MPVQFRTLTNTGKSRIRTHIVHDLGSIPSTLHKAVTVSGRYLGVTKRGKLINISGFRAPGTQRFDSPLLPAFAQALNQLGVITDEDFDVTLAHHRDLLRQREEIDRAKQLIYHLKDLDMGLSPPQIERLRNILPPESHYLLGSSE